METTNLTEFLRGATPYERWRAQLDPRLRQAVILSAVSIATALVALLALPDLLRFSDSGLFLVLRPQFQGILVAMYHARDVLIALNLLSVAVYVALLVATHGLDAGRATWHWAAFGEVAIGAANGFILALEVAIIVLNLVVWAVIITVLFLVLLIGLGGGGAGS